MQEWIHRKPRSPKVWWEDMKQDARELAGAPKIKRAGQIEPQVLTPAQKTCNGIFNSVALRSGFCLLVLLLGAALGTPNVPDCLPQNSPNLAYQCTYFWEAGFPEQLRLFGVMLGVASFMAMAFADFAKTAASLWFAGCCFLSGFFALDLSLEVDPPDVLIEYNGWGWAIIACIVFTVFFLGVMGNVANMLEDK